MATFNQIMVRIVATATALFLTGCAVRTTVPATWRLTALRLVPPYVAADAPANQTFVAYVGAGERPCAADSAPIALRKEKRRLRGTVQGDGLAREPSGWLSRWAFTLEAEKCVTPGGAVSLARQVSETVVLEPNGAFRLLNPVDPAGDWIELPPGTRLQLNAPILRDASAPAIGDAVISGLAVTVRASDNLIGFETITYDVRAQTGGPGAELVLRAVQKTIDGVEQSAARPSANYISLAADANLFRLVFKTGQTAYTALLIGARSPAEMDTMTANLNSCTQLPPDRCVAIPRSVGVSPVVPVLVNGAEVALRFGASLGEAMRGAGWRSADSPPGLSVSRPHRGHPVRVEFDPGDRTIMSMVALAGDTVAWDQTKAAAGASAPLNSLPQGNPAPRRANGLWPN